jgi:hypothetical protein
VWVELVKEPEALLSIAQRQRARVISLRDARQRQSRAGGKGQLNRGSHLVERGFFKKAAKREVNQEGLTDSGDELSGEQGVAAEVEEVVEQAYAIEMKEVGPDVCEQDLNLRDRSEERGVKQRAIEGRQRKSRAI